MRPPLRFLVCGGGAESGDTLIDRIIGDGGPVVEDQPSGRAKRPRQDGAGDEPGMTLDVACRQFATPARRLILAVPPGDREDAGGTAIGASAAALAVLLVDARAGVRGDALRHSRVVSLFGVRHIVLAVDKMDLIDWDQGRYEAIARDYLGLVADFGFSDIRPVPICLRDGANLVRPPEDASWYRGPTVLDLLETIEMEPPANGEPFRMPVQSVERRGKGPRGYRGRIAAGAASPGDRVRLAPSGREARIAAISDRRGEREAGHTGELVTIALEPAPDIGPGEVIAAAEDPVEVGDQFQAILIWMAEDALMAGRPYLMKLHDCQVGATVTRIKHRLDPADGTERAAAALALDQTGAVNIATDRPVAFAPHAACKALGGFTLIDRTTNATVGAGAIDFALRRAANIHWQALEVTRATRAALKLQRPACLWLTGLSGSGKSTIANLLEQRLLAEGWHTYLLDGDNVRHGLNRDLGFTEADRVENIRRVAEVARLMVDAGLVVIVAFISPFRAEREFARRLFEPGEFLEIYIDALLATCEARDIKGLYAKARRGALKNFTGIDSAYEPPLSPELHLDTESMTPDESVQSILGRIDRTLRSG